jgi:hypothetical protein
LLFYFSTSVFLKNRKITNLNNQIGNFNSILVTKKDQLTLSQELSKKLQTDLKKQRLKNKITTGVGIAAVIATAFLVK